MQTRRFNPLTLKKYVLLTGHYGSGKTNVTMQLALDLVCMGKKVAIVDLDIVNPYFRSSDYTNTLEAAGISVIAPRFARTALDTPSLTAAVYAVFEKTYPADFVLFDVGGDDVGSTALGRFEHYFESIDYQMIAVVNYFRNLTQTATETREVLHEIEGASKLKISAIINNSHLHKQTTIADIIKGERYAQEVAAQENLPLLCTTISDDLLSRASDEELAPLHERALYPIKIHVMTPWDSDTSVLGG